MGEPDTPDAALITDKIDRQLAFIHGARLAEEHIVWGELYILVTVVLKFLSEDKLRESQNLHMPGGGEANRRLSVIVYGDSPPDLSKVALIRYEYGEAEKTGRFEVERFTSQYYVQYKIVHREKGPDSYEEVDYAGYSTELQGRNYEEKIEKIIVGLTNAIASITGLKPFE